MFLIQHMMLHPVYIILEKRRSQMMQELFMIMYDGGVGEWYETNEAGEIYQFFYDRN